MGLATGKWVRGGIGFDHAPPFGVIGRQIGRRGGQRTCALVVAVVVVVVGVVAIAVVGVAAVGWGVVGLTMRIRRCPRRRLGWFGGNAATERAGEFIEVEARRTSKRAAARPERRWRVELCLAETPRWTVVGGQAVRAARQRTRVIVIVIVAVVDIVVVAG